MSGRAAEQEWGRRSSRRVRTSHGECVDSSQTTPPRAASTAAANDAAIADLPDSGAPEHCDTSPACRPGRSAAFSVGLSVW